MAPADARRLAGDRPPRRPATRRGWAIVRIAFAVLIAATVAYPDRPGPCHGCRRLGWLAAARERTLAERPARLAELEAWRWDRLSKIPLGDDATESDRADLLAGSEEYLARYAALQPPPERLWMDCQCPGRVAPLEVDTLQGDVTKRPRRGIQRRIWRAYHSMNEQPPGSRR